nr:hypothetical protein [Bradyrhizobium sp. 41S5]
MSLARDREPDCPDLSYHQAMQRRAFIDVEVVDVYIADIEVCKLAAEGVPATYSSAFMLVQIQNPCDISRRRMRRRSVEWDNQSDRHAHLAKILCHRHHGIRTKRVPYQYNGSTLARSIVRDNFVGNASPLGVIGDIRGDASRAQLDGKVVHAQREDIQQSAKQVGVRRG